MENAHDFSDEETNAVRETQYLNSIPGMAESLKKGRETPFEDCIPEDEVKW